MKKFVIKTGRYRKLLSLLLILVLFVCAAVPPAEAEAAQTGDEEESILQETEADPAEPSEEPQDASGEAEEEPPKADGEESPDPSSGTAAPEGQGDETPLPSQEVHENREEGGGETSGEIPEKSNEEVEELPKDIEEDSEGTPVEEMEEAAEESGEEELLMKAPLLGASGAGSLPDPLGTVTVGRQGRTPLPVYSRYVNYTRCWYVIHNNVKYWAVCSRASASGSVPPESPDSRTVKCRYNHLNAEAVNGIAAWQKAVEDSSTVPIKKNQGHNARLAKAVLVSMFTRASFWKESFSNFTLSYAAAHLLVSDLLFGDDNAATGKNYNLVFKTTKSNVEKWLEDPGNAALVDSCKAYIAYFWDGGSDRGRQSVVWVEGLPGVMDLRKRAEDKEGNTVSGQDLTGTTYVLYKDHGCSEPAKDVYGKDAVFVCDKDGEADAIVLPIGTYYLKETKAAPGMELDKEIYTTELVRSTSFSNYINFHMNKVTDKVKDAKPGEGSLIIQKRDSETGRARGGASLQGAVYDLIVDQEEGVTDEKGTYKNGDVYGTLKTDEEGRASLEKIPEGAYILKERTASKGYKVSVEARKILIENGSTLSLTGEQGLPEEIIRAPFSFAKTGSDDRKMAGVVFRVTCQESGESWEIVTGEDGIYDSLKEKEPARQRLLYGTYLLEELPCPANEGYTLCESETFRVGSEKAVDLGTFVNYRGPSAGTVLTDEKGNRYLKAGGRITLKDTVTLHDMLDYKDQEIRLKGRLVDAETRETVAEAEKKVTLESAEQTLIMDFELDASGLGGKSLVAFEYVYDKDGKLITKHENLRDKNQTVHFPAIQTTAVCEGTEDQVLSSCRNALIRDTVSYTGLEGGKTYRIDGILYDTADGKPFLAGGSQVKSSVSFTAEASGQGSVTAEFSFDIPKDMEGKVLVAAESLFNAGGDLLAEHKDLKDEKQTVWVPGIGTQAQDLMTGDHAGTVSEQTSFRDKVTYTGLSPKKKYEIRGTLMVRETGKPLLDDGKKITASRTFTPETSDGVIYLDFTFDASDLAGETVVAFEELYHKGIKVAAHADLQDKEQSLVYPGIRTTACDIKTGDHLGISFFDRLTGSSGETTITDRAELTGLMPGYVYRVKGTLYDRESGQALRGKNGREITAETEITASAEKETVELTFRTDLSVPGKTLVVCEDLIHNDVVIASHNDLTDEEQSVHFPEITTSAMDQATGSHLGTPSKKALIRDRVSYTNLIPSAGDRPASYTMKGTLMVKTTGEPLLDKEGKEITSQVTFSPESPSGSVDLTFEFDASLLQGETVVCFEKMYREDILVAVHADLEDREQSVFYPAIITRASHDRTGTQLGYPGEEQSITDMVTYENLLPGTYVVQGLVIDSGTGLPFTDAEGKEIRAEKIFTAEEMNGQVPVTFNFRAKGLTGRTLTVFETLYTRGGTLIASHEDSKDRDQMIFYPGITTKAEDGETHTNAGPVKDLVTITDHVFYNNLIPSTQEDPREYTVKGTLMVKSTGKPLLDENGEEITSAHVFSPEKADGCEDLVFTFSSALLAGETVVCFESLYEKDIEVAVHADLEDRDQSVFYPSVTTRAADNRTGTHTGSAGEEKSLTDMVTYKNLLPGTYLVKGLVIDSGTGLPFTDAEGKEIRAEKTFTAEEMNGYVPVTFTFRAEGLSGRTLTVFETLYTEGGTLIASHEDSEDRDQMIFYPGITTEAEDGVTHTHTGPVKELVTITDHVWYNNLIPSTQEDPREYTVKGTLMVKSSGKPLLNEKGEPVTSEHVFSPEKADGCEDLVFTFSSALLAGETVVCFESLYEKDIEVAVHADLEDHEQSVYYPSIRTNASVSGKKSVTAKGKVTLEDMVEYKNLIPGTEYELTGILMDKKSGKPLEAGGGQVRASAKLIPEEESGICPVTFTFDASGLGERTLVVFETLSLSGIEVAVHADLEDKAQTVTLTPPPAPPKTGDEAGPALWILLALSGLAAAGLLLKRRRKTGK